MRSRPGSDDVTGAVELEDGTRIEFLNVRLDGLAIRVQERPTVPVPWMRAQLER
jgi:hypothetical protein